MTVSKLRESYMYMIAHPEEYSQLTVAELDRLALQLEFLAMDRNKGIEYEYNQDTQ